MGWGDMRTMLCNHVERWGLSEINEALENCKWCQGQKYMYPYLPIYVQINQSMCQVVWHLQTDGYWVLVLFGTYCELKVYKIATLVYLVCFIIPNCGPSFLNEDMYSIFSQYLGIRWKRHVRQHWFENKVFF